MRFETLHMIFATPEYRENKLTDSLKTLSSLDRLFNTELSYKEAITIVADEEKVDKEPVIL